MSILDGISLTALQSQLSALQQALFALDAGSYVVTATYTQGDGSKSVTYTAADRARLTQAILSVQTQIARVQGQRMNVRKPIRPFF